MEQSNFIKINPADLVVVCLRPYKKGEVIEVDGKSMKYNRTPCWDINCSSKTRRKTVNIIKWLSYRSFKRKFSGWSMDKRKQS